MDARTVIAEELDRYVISPHMRADGVIAALRAANIDLVHRDENHGPTLERAAEVAKSFDARKDILRTTGHDIAAAIRAMEVKHHGG